MYDDRDAMNMISENKINPPHYALKGPRQLINGMSLTDYTSGHVVINDLNIVCQKD